MSERKTFKNLVKNQLHKLSSIVFVEEEEIIDDGLDEKDFIESNTILENTSIKENKQETISTIEEKVESIEEIDTDIEVKHEVEEVKTKHKKSFMKTKTKTLEEDLFKPEETKTTMELIKENPVPMVEIIETKEPPKKFFSKPDFKFEKAKTNVNNTTDELTKEQKEAKEFHDKLDSSELLINKIRKNVLFKNIENQVFGNGFEDTFFELMETIEDNQLLEKSEKTLKMNTMLSNLMNTNNSEEEIYDYFMNLRHELHKAKNNLGEYDKKVYRNKELQIPYILEYNIPEMFENRDSRLLLLDSDVQIFTQLMSLVDEMYTKLDKNSFVSNSKRERMQGEYTDLLWSSTSTCEILKNIELLKYDLYKLDNGLDEFSKTALALY